MHEYYEKKAKDNEELIACWCWVIALFAVVACCVAMVKWLIAFCEGS